VLSQQRALELGKRKIGRGLDHNNETMGSNSSEGKNDGAEKVLETVVCKYCSYKIFVQDKNWHRERCYMKKRRAKSRRSREDLDLDHNSSKYML